MNDTTDKNRMNLQLQCGVSRLHKLQCGAREMSIERVENEIRRLLSDKRSEVVCISGLWGVGKTFAWRKFLGQAKDRKNGIALRSYSYVSLFGISSLDELKYALFANTVSSGEIGIEPSLDTLRSNTIAVAKKLGRQGAPLIQSLVDRYVMKTPAGTTSFLGYFSIKESIICIDDIERRGDKLAVRDVFGLISSLKEEKRCKVILMLNDDAMANDREKDEFAVHSEKVIDIHLKFAPTARESVAIALSSPEEHFRLLGEHCVALGIANIRIIKKLERAVAGLEPILKEFDKAILNRAIHSLVLLGWSHFDRLSARPLDFLLKRIPRFDNDKSGERLGEREAARNVLLEFYRFGSVDEFDVLLLRGVQDGYFDETLLKELARLLNQQIRDAAASDAYGDAWKLFHESFQNNGEELAEKMVSAFTSNARRINLGDMHGTVELLKAIGKGDEAMKVINAYVTQNADKEIAFDRSRQMFGDQLTDPDLVQALDIKLKSFAVNRDPLSVLLSMTEGWKAADISYLRRLDVDAYYRAFKAATGDSLRRIIANCLQFERIVNVGEAEKEVAALARKALERIGSESPLNALRVRKFGIRVDPNQQSMESARVSRVIEILGCLQDRQAAVLATCRNASACPGISAKIAR